MTARFWKNSNLGWAGANVVFWNCEGPYLIQKPPTAQNFSFGHIGLRARLGDLDQFAYIAGFSGGGDRAEWEKADSAVLSQKLKVLWLGCGREDPGYNGVKSMENLLTKKDIKHVWDESRGGHSWPNWQVYLSKYAPLLFRQ